MRSAAHYADQAISQLPLCTARSYKVIESVVHEAQQELFNPLCWAVCRLHVAGLLPTEGALELLHVPVGTFDAMLVEYAKTI